MLISSIPVNIRFVDFRNSLESSIIAPSTPSVYRYTHQQTIAFVVVANTHSKGLSTLVAGNGICILKQATLLPKTAKTPVSGYKVAVSGNKVA